jgi:hypothetical protein
MADDDFEDFDSTAQLNKLIYIKKSFNLNKTQTVSASKQAEFSENLNLTLKLNTLVDDISSERLSKLDQKSPEFPKEFPDRMFPSDRQGRF